MTECVGLCHSVPMKVMSLRSFARSAETLGIEPVLLTHQGRVVGRFIPGDALDALIALDRDDGDLRNAVQSAGREFRAAHSPKIDVPPDHVMPGFGEFRPAPKTGSASRPAHPEPAEVGLDQHPQGAQAGLDPVGERTEAPHLGGSVPPADRKVIAPVRRSSFRPAPKPGK